jgi:hypothetical protein
VRKSGNSTGGESWDFEEVMDTYYNPVPHFGFQLALEHSPQLRGVPILPPDRAQEADKKAAAAAAGGAGAEEEAGGGGGGGDDDLFGPGIDSL